VEEAGSRQPYRCGWETIEEFASELSKVIDHEAMTIKETDFLADNDLRVAWIRLKGRGTKQVSVVVDRLERVHIKSPPASWDVQSISFSGQDIGFADVSRTEERYKGDEVISLVCYLQKGADEQ
jgi:hypothetical protein